MAGNAIKSGIFAKARVLPGVESAEEWDAHLAGFVASLKPADYVDQCLIEIAADASWGLRRVSVYEAAALAWNQAGHEAELAIFLARLAKQQAVPGWEVLELAEGGRKMSLDRAKELAVGTWAQDEAVEEQLRLAQVRQKPLPELAGAGKQLPLEAAQQLLLALLAEEELARQEVPALARTLLASTEESMSARTLWAAVIALAGAVEKPSWTLVEKATEHGRQREVLLRHLQAWVQAQRGILVGRQLLPDLASLQAINRRVGYLTRTFFRTLAQVDIRQARRRGETVPMGQIVHEALPEEGRPHEPVRGEDEEGGPAVSRRGEGGIVL